MKQAAALFAVNLVALSCIGGAICLAVNGIAGWGWFLFVALLCVQIPSD
jgi:hypothetical protein